jgi:hypothetical protein
MQTAKRENPDENTTSEAERLRAELERLRKEKEAIEKERDLLKKENTDLREKHGSARCTGKRLHFASQIRCGPHRRRGRAAGAVTKASADPSPVGVNIDVV